ncbi:MAG: PspA/IM30 family protein [Fimbriimonadaceae bacterium]|nr:PspA/IM30 family protein [Fimbriimonadaceae bacterium]
MGIGQRISRIIKSNVNDLLSAAENPEKQLDLAITEMEDLLRQAKQQLVDQLAVEKRLQRQLDEADEMAKMWAQRAQVAVDSGSDELAREALRKKRNYDELGSEYDKQLFEQQRAVDELRVQYKELEQRIKDFRERRRGIGTERVRREREGERTARTAPRRIDASALRDRSAFDKFEEMADKVEDLEARTQAERELTDYLEPDDTLAAKIDAAADRGRPRRSEDEVNVDIELEQMRRRVGRPAAPPPPTAPTPPRAPGERLSQRRGATPPAENAPPADLPPRRDPNAPPPEDDDDGWGRRVEL